MKAFELFLTVNLEACCSCFEMTDFVRDTFERALKTDAISAYVASESQLDEFSRRGILDLIEMRSKSVARSGRILHGANLALIRIAESDSENRFAWAAISVGQRLLVLVLELDCKQMVGCLALERDLSRHKWVTPPQWDGSEEMLKRYNEQQ